MIKRLRRKFVLISALSLFAVELLIISAINIINYVQIGQKEDKLLSILSENEGSFPEYRKPDQHIEPDSGEDPPPKPEEDKYTDYTNYNNKSGGFGDHMAINAETRYQTRYFSVRYSASGTADRIDTGHIASVTSEDALVYAAEVRSSGKTKGYTDCYKYTVRELEDGSKLYIFLDCRDNFVTKQRFLTISVLIAVGGIVLVTLLIIVLSKFAVRPFIENYEKQKMFITDAGHEIKTPLAIIQANTEVIELTSEPSEWTESIKNQISRLNGLIANLLRLSRMDEQTEKLTFSDFDLSEAFTDTAQPFVTLAETRGLTLDISAQEGIFVNGDEASLRQVVSILIENAVKYCDEGGGIKASLYRSSGGKWARIKVENDCKEPPEHPDRLFDRFYRADQSRSRKDGEKSGYGIGLSVAKAVCESHKGKISCKTENGRIIFTASVKFKS
ncbi:MAG: HAMP domain-containing histidine kinase [Ruminococcus sp.]|nr:HAMP domain-containing histidine kinase [Ruminococcus sp.]